MKRVARLLDDDAWIDAWVTGGNSSTTTVDVASTTSPHEYEIGQTLDFLTDGTYEALVITALPGTPNLTVRRGHRDTTAATHAAGAVFRVNPDFLSHVIGQLVEEAVLRLYPDIPEVKVATYTTPASPVDTWYALPADTEEVFKVYQIDATNSVEELVSPDRRSAGPTWFHAGFVSTSKGIFVENVDSAITNFYILYGARPSITTLTDAQEDVVCYGAARRALELYSTRPARRDDRAVFGAESKIQLFRREEKSIREQEQMRLNQYLPRRNSIVWNPGRIYTEGL